MDLTTHRPRSLKDRLAGYVHIGRMIDKCRAVLAGTQGEYIFPCPLDRRLLDFAALTSEQFLRAVNAHPNDEAMANWFLRTAAPHRENEIDAWNRTMLALGPDTEEKWTYFKNTRDAIDPARTDVTTWADLLDLEERRAVTIRNIVDR